MRMATDFRHGERPPPSHPRRLLLRAAKAGTGAQAPRIVRNWRRQIGMTAPEANASQRYCFGVPR